MTNLDELRRDIIKSGSENKEELKLSSPGSDPQYQNNIKRRKFLGLGIMSTAAFCLPGSSYAAANDPVEKFVTSVISSNSEILTKQSDSFEDKVVLLREAWAKKDYRLVRSLGDSIRHTGIQSQIEEEDPGNPLMAAGQFGLVSSLSAPWKTWATGWKYYKALALEEKAGISRKLEPVEVLLSFPSDQVTSLYRELRVAEVTDGRLSEVPCQVYAVMRRGAERLCKLMFLANSGGGEKKTYLVFYGNPDAELPDYVTDLRVRGEGYNLEIENQYYIAKLSPQTGQLERMLLKREHGVELYAGGPGHGETACIDWAHDYVSEDNFMKVRIQYWGECPDYEIIKGPVCTIVRRWGLPHSALHPVYTPSRLNIDIEYRFYAGLPYFHKRGRMEAIKSFVAVALRDDEWVFTGQPFTDSLWMGSDERLKIGEIDAANKQSVKGFGYFNRDTKDSFVGLYLEHSAEVLPELIHGGSSMLYYNWHGTTWARYPLQRNQLVPKGAVLHQKNAYITIPFTAEEGPARIEAMRKELMSPLRAGSLVLDKGITGQASKGRLARRGEAQDSSVDKRALWAALSSCIDQQLYISDVNLVELGYIYDLSVEGDVVRVLMTMPHRGRPQSSFFIWGSSVVHRSVSKTIVGALSEVQGVNKVIVDQTWYPEWNSNLITEEGRRKLGI